MRPIPARAHGPWLCRSVRHERRAHRLRARRQSIARITLDRPAKLNALTPAMLAQLSDAAGRIDADDDIRAVVLSAAGERAFCVGADIDAWADASPLDMWRHWVRDGHAVFAPHGLAAASPHRRDRGSGSRPVAWSSRPRRTCVSPAPTRPSASRSRRGRAARLVRHPAPRPHDRARAGQADGARRRAARRRRVRNAAAWCTGLVLQAAARRSTRRSAWPQRIASRAPVAVQLAKQLIDAAVGENRAATLEALAAGVAGGTQDGREGVASFREKRAAGFLEPMNDSASRAMFPTKHRPQNRTGSQWNARDSRPNRV